MSRLCWEHLCLSFLSSPEIRGWGAVPAAGLQGNSSQKRSVFSQTPIRISKLRRAESNFPGDYPWAWEFQPLRTKIMLESNPPKSRNPKSEDWPYPRAAESGMSSWSWPDRGLSSPAGRSGYFTCLGEVRAFNGSQNDPPCERLTACLSTETGRRAASF